MKKSIILFVAILINSFAFGQTMKVAKRVNATAASASSPAPTCPVSMQSKRGKVYSVAPGLLTVRSKYKEVVVELKKTAGVARAQVNIYVNGSLKQKMKFDAGNFTKTKTRTLTNVKGKNIKVEIINQSVANTFSYSLKLKGKRRSLEALNGKAVTGMLLYNKTKTIFANASCSGRTKIIFKRTNGYAKVVMNVYESRNNGRTYNSSPIRVMQVNGNEAEKVFTVNSGSKLKIVVKNVSNGKLVKYRINPVVTN